jgi:hypothetical protein
VNLSQHDVIIKSLKPDFQRYVARCLMNFRNPPRWPGRLAANFDEHTVGAMAKDERTGRHAGISPANEPMAENLYSSHQAHNNGRLNARLMPFLKERI